MKEIVEKILKFDVFTSKEFFILFDDLDIKFTVENHHASEKLLNLLRAAKNLNTSLFRNSKVKVLIFLRDDIRKILETKDSDTSKLFSSYEINLNWYDHQNFRFNENQINLKKFVNKRIEINFKANGIPYMKEDPWSSLFREDYYNYNNKSSFKYILDQTFYRPRDMVLFLSAIGKQEYTFPLEYKQVRILLKKYIEENIKEIKSELKIHLSDRELQQLFNVCRLISDKNSYSKEQIFELIRSEFTEQKDINKIFSLLTLYSILVYKDENKVYYTYRENNLDAIDFSQLSFWLHPCVYNYFQQSY